MFGILQRIEHISSSHTSASRISYEALPRILHLVELILVFGSSFGSHNCPCGTRHGIRVTLEKYNRLTGGAIREVYHATCETRQDTMRITVVHTAFANRSAGCITSINTLI